MFSTASEFDGQFDYRATFECATSAIAAIGLPTLRAAFAETDFPGGTYAVFKQTNPPERIVHNLNYMYCIWLGKSDYQFDDRTEFEKYAPDYQPDNPSGYFLYGIPVKKRE